MLYTIPIKDMINQSSIDFPLQKALTYAHIFSFITQPFTCEQWKEVDHSIILLHFPIRNVLFP